MSINEIASIVVGGLITILVTIVVEVLRRPRLRLSIAEPVDATYEPGRPAATGRYLYINLMNDPLPWFARWMSRNAALQCTGTMTFHHLDGERFFARIMPVRFSETPEPVGVPIVLGDIRGVIFDPSRAAVQSRVDVYPGEIARLDVAARFGSEEDAYGWSNLSYSSNPPWRNPDWKLPRGRYLVSVTVSSSGEKCHTIFRLLNEAGTHDFRLEPARSEDHIGS